MESSILPSWSDPIPIISYCVLLLLATYFLNYMRKQCPAITLHSFLDLVTHPDELWASLIVLCRYIVALRAARSDPSLDDNDLFCIWCTESINTGWFFLFTTFGKGFQLPLAVFYCILRALDSIEDDTTIPKKVRIEEIKKFADRLQQPGFNFRNKGYGGGLNVLNNDGVRIAGEIKPEVVLLEQFDKVIAAYGKLRPEIRAIISDITNRMAGGMITFLEKPVNTLDDYNQYCCLASGIVGLGLTSVVQSCGGGGGDVLSTPSSRLGGKKEMDESDGLIMSTFIFGQKYNNIRDYWEDVNQPTSRVLYPRQIWGKYVDNVKDLMDPKFEKRALLFLNEMIADAIQVIPSCLTYLSTIEGQPHFQFFAVAQLSGVLLLERLYDNPKVFHSIVEMRKGEHAKLICAAKSFASVVAVYEKCFLSLERRLRPGDTQAKRIVGNVLEEIKAHKAIL